MLGLLLLWPDDLEGMGVGWAVVCSHEAAGGRSVDAFRERG